MPNALTVIARLKQTIGESDEAVFLRAEFSGLGSAAQVGRALRALQTAGTIVKLGLGIYAKAKPSALSGSPIPVRPLDVLAPVVMQKLGVAVFPSVALRAYNEGSTTQVPAGVVLNTGGRRIRRTVGFGSQRVLFESEPRKRRRSEDYPA
ncbi:DUF6088 family protein [Burkholderia pseudomallei]|uniref:DUF6088 family protein n=1 Tax=Burkholderia pseudomallei TaxID=28450 RepID=UPI000537D123|nr:DUF6088 family protein [Burkholderia pseudomallei]KGX39584.1 putative s-adenosylhomocysteine hydrolase [Burkholderia pseudomallei MSHR2138]KGX47843.1 putative s-adenosylhomocysteine hydrolase [Burkholderia pseudomallei MSHR3709]